MRGGSELSKQALRDWGKNAFRYSALVPRGVVILRRVQQRIRDLRCEPRCIVARPRLYVSLLGDPETLGYALRQWRGLLEGVEVVLIVERSDAVSPSDIPNGWGVVSLSDVMRLHATGNQAGSVVLYLVNSKKNFGLIGSLYRFRHLLVFHGEGDKIANQTASWRAYPEIAVSGDAAVERLRKVGVKSRLHIIGRPQVPPFAVLVRDRGGGILYAPTWEGGNERENYSSLLMELRQPLIDLLGNQGQRVIVKLHPKTGVRRADFAFVSAAWREVADRTPGMVFASPERDVREFFAAARVLVTDISSVAADFMPSLRPIVYLNPFGVDRAEFTRRFPTTRHAHIASSTEEFRISLADALGQGSVVGADREALIRHVVPFWGEESRRAFFRALALGEAE